MGVDVKVGDRCDVCFDLRVERENQRISLSRCDNVPGVGVQMMIIQLKMMKRKAKSELI